MATEDARYRLSSQYRLWSFSRAELASLREKSNSLARASISERLSRASSSSEKNNNDRSASTSNANTPDPDGASFRLPEFLTVADESLMTTFYTTQLLGAGSATGLSDEICATAAAFFRRFYITNSIMTYSPQDMMIVALFFACKAEGWFTRVTDFLKMGSFRSLKKQPEDILAGEFLFCQGIRFAFDVRHPFRPLIGAGMELRRLGDIKEERIRAAEERAKSILRFSSLVTDAYFHYTPSQIMLAALSLADRELAERLIHETFHHITPPANKGTPTNGGDGAPNDSHQPKGQNKEAIIGQQIRDKVLGTIEACREMMAHEMPERSKEHWQSKDMYQDLILPIKKKLKKCRDPDRSNLVALQRARREEALKKGDSDDGDPEDRGGTVDDDAAVFGEAARDAKRRKVAKGLDDPFGGPL
ncbi:cyclin-like protein [Lasiosphaeria miniovina]|uniref:Cyclin-like protein n=1 Tax=Lasiosphaeria miniovina TaxID=1954250 RepID=A0AA40B4P6_9PEZI|nr:cyclin-like protein [Lasiosphaeria miniovina]KAK0727620.1 cyclin-like protein [Lasiosphaeria miniovina]